MVFASTRSLGLYLCLCTAALQSHVANSFTASKLTTGGLTQLYESVPSSSVESSTFPTRADDLIEALWGSSKGRDSTIDAIVSACSQDVVWEDMRLKTPAQGTNEVRKLLEDQLPEGTTVIVDKKSDGASSAGFTWTRECDGKLGLRGTSFLKLNDEGKIECLKELAEPLYKPGDMMLKLLQAATKDVPRPEKNPTYVQETPEKCSDIVDYIWNKAYPKDAPVEEAVRFYSDSIVYQDFNYPLPIRGVADVEKFSREWGDFPGIEFGIQDLSEGDKACVFTWRVKVNGQEGPQGISFYETDGKGKITYIRDTPSPSFIPIFGNLAGLLRPKLRTFRSRKDMVDGIPVE